MNIESAFETLFEKAVAKGATKKNNANYRLAFDKNGHKKWILVNKHEVDAHPGEELTNDEFHKHRAKGTVSIHHDEVPTVNSPFDLEMISFLSPGQTKTILSNLDKIKFFEGSIKLARSLKREDVVNGHTTSMNLYKQKNVEILTKAFNGKNTENVLDEATVEELNKDNKVTITGFSDSASDFLNTYYKGFDFPEFIQDCKNTFDETRKNLAANLDVDEVKRFDPEIKILLSGSRFSISISQPANPQKDKFGFEHSVEIMMSRIFQKQDNMPIVDHSSFSVGKGLRGSFAKNMMKSLYKQYINSNVDSIMTHANCGSDEPINGENTWGKWGFTMKTNRFESYLQAMQGQVGKTRMVEQFFIKHKDENKIVRSSTSKNGNQYDEEITRQGFTDKNTGLVNTFGIITKSTGRPDEGYKSRVSRSIEVKQEHIDQAKSIFKAWKKENPNEKDFRVKELYDKMHKDVVLAIMKGDWQGECRLSNPKQREDYESNLFKQYPVKNNTQLS